MCTFQRAAPWSSTVEATALADDVYLVFTRKLPSLDHTPSIDKYNFRQNGGCIFVKYQRRNYGSSFSIFLQTRFRIIQPVLVSSAVVFVTVSLCVCALHARTSLDTATTPRTLYLAAVLCVALVFVLTVATKCYASTATSPALSQPSQTLAQPSPRTFTALRLVQSVSSSIVQPRRFSRNYFALKRKKRTVTDLDVVVYRSSNNSADNSDRPQVLNVSDTSRNLTNSVNSVGRLAIDNSGPQRKQSTVRPMPSAHDEPTHTVSDDIGGGIETGGGTASGGGSDTGGGGNRFLALVISAALLTVTLGLITCVVNYYRDTTTSLGTLPPGTTRQQQHSLATDEHHVPVIAQPITAPMLSVVSASAAGMDAGGGGAAGRLHRHVTRELAVQRDRQVRLHSVHTDLELDLPPSIALPDGEELPYGSSARLHIRDPEQESEIYQKCIRPPPNRTVFESESPPPYRSSSAGLLGSLGGSTTSSSTTGVSTDWSTGSTPFVVRCHSMSSTSTMTAKRTLEPQVTTPAPTATCSATAGGQKTDFLQRTVKIFTGKKTLTQPAPTLPGVVVPTTTTSVRTTRRLAEQPAPTRAKHQGNV